MHNGIIDEDFFREVQNIFNKDENAERKYEDSQSLLKGIIKCGNCNCLMTPTRCNRHSRQYRYYTCSIYIRTKNCDSMQKNILAGEVEECVNQIVCQLLKDSTISADILKQLGTSSTEHMPELQEHIKDMESVSSYLHIQQKKEIMNLMIKDVFVNDNGLNVVLNKDFLESLINKDFAFIQETDNINIISIGFDVKKQKSRRSVITTPDGAHSEFTEIKIDKILLKALAKAHLWKREISHKKYASVSEFAASKNITPTYIRRILNLCHLSPKIQEMILNGKFPKYLNL